MMNYEEYHARCMHALTCPHDVVWMVEPIISQLHDPETPVLLHDQQYIGDMIKRLAEQIDSKDNQLHDNIESMEEASFRLRDCARKLLIVSACWVATVGVLFGVLIAR